MKRFRAKTAPMSRRRVAATASATSTARCAATTRTHRPPIRRRGSIGRAKAKEAKLPYIGNALTESRHGLSVELGSARLGSARLGSGNMRIMALFLEARMSHRGDSMRLGGGLSRAAPFDCNSA
jgi:hypothetical protein